MVRVWVAGKTVWSHCFTQAISERLTDKGLIIKRYINSSVYFSLLYFTVEEFQWSWHQVAIFYDPDAGYVISYLLTYTSNLVDRPRICLDLVYLSGRMSVYLFNRLFLLVFSSDHRRSQDFVWGCTFLPKKLTTFFSRRPHIDRLIIPPNLRHPAETVLKIDSCSGWGCTSCPERCTYIFSL